MILLDKSDYPKVIEPLLKVEINNLFARAVVEDQVNGSVYVDNAANPRTFYISHPYGMSLLFGEMTNEAFNAGLVDYVLNTTKRRNKIEWLQAYPAAWNAKLEELFGEKIVKSTNEPELIKNAKIEEHTRVNFKFNTDKYLDFKKKINGDYELLRTDKTMYDSMTGSVIPMYFWKDADQFCTNGIGFTLIREGKLASTAFSAFVFDSQLEIGIETSPEFHGQGLAMQTCSSLIYHCLENNLEPVWGCRLENQGSYKLAQKIGFEPTFYIPFYKLNYSSLSLNPA